MTLIRRLIQLLWPLPGAAGGAVLGFHLYFAQPAINTDSLAPLVLAGLWALTGMLAGALITGLGGWVFQLGMRRLSARSPTLAAGVILVLLTVASIGLTSLLDARLPGWIWPPKAPAAIVQPSGVAACAQVPPVESKEFKAWALECR